MEEKKDYIGGTAHAAKELVNGFLDLTITNTKAFGTMLEKYGTGISEIYQAAKKESVNPIKGFAQTFRESLQSYRTMMTEVKTRTQAKPNSIDEVVETQPENTMQEQPNSEEQNTGIQSPE